MSQWRDVTTETCTLLSYYQGAAVHHTFLKVILFCSYLHFFIHILVSETIRSLCAADATCAPYLSDAYIV